MPPGEQLFFSARPEGGPLAAVVMTLNGVFFPSQIRWCLLPVFARSTGDGPVASPPFFCADVGGIHAGPGPVQGVGRVQLG